MVIIRGSCQMLLRHHLKIATNATCCRLRDGCCNTDENDRGVHTVCAKVTSEFLEWSKKVGNDLITPHPEFGFPGLKDGDCWCVCATWYARSIEENKACTIFLKKTNIKTLKLIPLEKLKKFAADLS